jgi:hypothetical protein
MKHAKGTSFKSEVVFRWLVFDKGAMVNMWRGQNSHEVDQGCSHCGMAMVESVVHKLKVHLPAKCGGMQ